MKLSKWTIYQCAIVVPIAFANMIIAMLWPNPYTVWVAVAVVVASVFTTLMVGVEIRRESRANGTAMLRQLQRQPWYKQ